MASVPGDPDVNMFEDAEDRSNEEIIPILNPERQAPRQDAHGVCVDKRSARPNQEIGTGLSHGVTSENKQAHVVF